ncbi:MAG: hypothetical protein MAG551_01588 [Candidatus Scalindua arabica]|uniref:PilZ domain-containing protein n=1 Tax=Candidatus Scalindua arabica TaxID=1127984 RepID=A0A941W2Z6_9BACT|nr:hypothetical protein [Candidatus Scalindua arabica]
MYDIAEKRRFKRIEKPYMTRFRTKPGGIWDMVAVNDLGAGGIFFNSSNNFEVGTVMDLKIGFSKSAPAIKCDGVVTRVIRHPDTLLFGIGTAFSKIDEHVKEMINKVAEVNHKINKLNFSDIAATLSLAS